MIIPFDRTIPFNTLPLLPPPPEQTEAPEILKALTLAGRALGELKGFARMLPNQSMLVNTIALREAKASTAIENIFTTDDALYKAMSDSEANPDANAKEVLRYRQALWHGYSIIKNENKISLDLLTGLYREVKQASDGIRPPQSETVIKKRGTGSMEGSVVYTPPRGEKIIEEKLNNLVDYLNNDTLYTNDPLLKLAIAHYQFEAIHPFRDGNGRTGRILNLLVMIQKELLDVPILYLSAYIIEHKNEYYELLNKVTSQRSWQDWILYILKAIEETAKYTIQKINDIDRLFKNTAALINKNMPKTRKETIEKMFEQPYISPKRLLDDNMKSINTSKKFLEQVKDLKIVYPKKIGKEVVYINADLFELLSEI